MSMSSPSPSSSPHPAAVHRRSSVGTRRDIAVDRSSNHSPSLLVAIGTVCASPASFPSTSMSLSPQERPAAAYVKTMCNDNLDSLEDQRPLSSMAIICDIRARGNLVSDHRHRGTNTRGGNTTTGLHNAK